MPAQIQHDTKVHYPWSDWKYGFNSNYDQNLFANEM